MENLDFDPAEERREDYRSSALAALPERASPRGRFAAQQTIVFVLAAAALASVSGPTAREFAAVAAALVFSNVFEWTLHRYVMHRPVFPRMIYEDHTRRHHRIYRHYDMAMRDWREIPFISFSPTLFVGIIVMAALVASAVWWGFGRNKALLFFGTETLYVLVYDLLHLSYHLPEDHPIGRLGPIRWLGNWHRRHHDPRLMRKFNFNVTLPLADWLFRTVAPKEE